MILGTPIERVRLCAQDVEASRVLLLIFGGACVGRKLTKCGGARLFPAIYYETSLYLIDCLLCQGLGPNCTDSNSL